MAIGCADGSVRLFDRRLSSPDARVITWREHNAWVLGAFFRKSKGSATSLITGSSSGDVRFFDFRKNSSVQNLQISQSITAFAVHDAADIFAR